MPMPDRILIVGAGQAAIQAIDVLRRKGFAGELTLVGDESSLPYQRPPLSKKFLSGALAQERLLIKPATFYSDHRVRTFWGDGPSIWTATRAQFGWMTGLRSVTTRFSSLPAAVRATSLHQDRRLKASISYATSPM